jgi:hypothetical protein
MRISEAASKRRGRPTVIAAKELADFYTAYYPGVVFRLSAGAIFCTSQSGTDLVRTLSSILRPFRERKSIGAMPHAVEICQSIPWPKQRNGGCPRRGCYAHRRPAVLVGPVLQGDRFGRPPKSNRCCLDEIAARAGTSRTTAQSALREAKRLGVITVQERRHRGRPLATNIIQWSEERPPLDLRPAGLTRSGTLCLIRPLSERTYHTCTSAPADTIDGCKSA